jgi:hypothetical protein|tara:strand:- start:758 stop:997 length:240 start_codon:yes stop_codon:yes gene_type:complete
LIIGKAQKIGFLNVWPMQVSVIPVICDLNAGVWERVIQKDFQASLRLGQPDSPSGYHMLPIIALDLVRAQSANITHIGM